MSACFKTKWLVLFVIRLVFMTDNDLLQPGKISQRTTKREPQIDTKENHAGEPEKKRYWWPVLGALIGSGALLWVFFRIDLEQLRTTLANADPRFLALLLASLMLEQLLQGWKWRQLLFPIKSVATLRLFGSIMAGYLANFLLPLGISPFVRSWLVARLDGLKMSEVLATTAISRLVDGFIFLIYAAVVLFIAVFPDPSGDVRRGLLAGTIGSLLLFPLLTILLIRHRHNMLAGSGWLLRLTRLLPKRAVERSEQLLLTFAEGVVWPRQFWSSAGIIVASALMKLVAASHFLWAGLAFGVLLNFIDYIFLVVFLGFLIIITRLARIPGAFVVGGIFALNRFGLSQEDSLAMVASVQLLSMLSIASVGAVTLWRNGISLGQLQNQKD